MIFQTPFEDVPGAAAKPRLAVAIAGQRSSAMHGHGHIILSFLKKRCRRWIYVIGNSCFFFVGFNGQLNRLWWGFNIFNGKFTGFSRDITEHWVYSQWYPLAIQHGLLRISVLKWRMLRHVWLPEGLRQQSETRYLWFPFKDQFIKLDKPWEKTKTFFILAQTKIGICSKLWVLTPNKRTSWFL
jgi:hypothetical protein